MLMFRNKSMTQH